MQQFMHEFPDVEKGELREPVQQHRPRVRGIDAGWKEMKDTLCTSNTDSEEEDELTGEVLPRTLDKISAGASPAAAPKAVSSYIEWPKRVLRQTILVSSNAIPNTRSEWSYS
jgi:hypothetical protein